MPATTAAAAPTPKPQTTWTLADPCAQAKGENDKAIDNARRGLARTLCQSVLWLDGLSGYPGNVRSARQANGRIELSYAHSAEESNSVLTGIDVNYRLPNLEHELSAFLGRDQANNYVAGRVEDFGLHTQLMEVEGGENWLAGLGYSVPGLSSGATTKLSVGASAGRQPKVFVQGRYLASFAVTESSGWYVRETVFWRSRGEGFGSTTTLDYDRALGPSLLLRWNTVATWSEENHGVHWRSSLMLYQNFHLRRAMAYETFVRGQSETGVPLREYGVRAFYRESLNGRWVYGELMGGYSWLKDLPDTPRRGSVMVGVGIDLLFGRANQ